MHALLWQGGFGKGGGKLGTKCLPLALFNGTRCLGGDLLGRGAASSASSASSITGGGESPLEGPEASVFTTRVNLSLRAAQNLYVSRAYQDRLATVVQALYMGRGTQECPRQSSRA